MGVIHPKAYQEQMQKVGIWPNYTEGALLLTQMQEEIFLGDSPDGSILNLQSSNVLMNQSPKTWPCLTYSDNPLRRQRYLAFLFARHFKHPTLNWPLNPEGSCFSAEKISHFEIWIICSNPQVSAKFMIEDDEEQMKEELKEAFRIYDKEVETKNNTEAKQ